MVVLTFTDKSGNLVRIPYIFLLHVICDKEAFTNDVIILGGRGFGKDDGGRGCRAKDDVTFYNMISGKNSNNLILKVGFIISKLI